MEWGNIPKQIDEYEKIVQMIDFLYSKNLAAFQNNVRLERMNWKNWPWDIVWKRENLQN
jgi:hypothetical protein